jgi:cell division protein FtsI (penicillin-binding protein 3)
VAFAGVVARLVQVQGVDADRYAAFGVSQRERPVALPADRGSVFDRQGRDLALSIPQTSLWANPQAVTDPRREAEALAPILNLDAAVLQDKLSSGGSFVYLARKVDDATAKKVKDLKLDGVQALSEPKRFLPAGDLATNVLGTVGLDNQGLSGLELQYGKLLAGRPGQLLVERDPAGRDIPGGVRRYVPSVRGSDLVLTIDRSLQYEAEKSLAAEIITSKAKGGMAVTMDSRTGEILAMVNLVAGEHEGDAPRPAANNEVVTLPYEPGSVNKLITISAALEEKAVKPSDKLMVPTSVRIGPATFSEHDPHPTQEWSITDIVANSSNVGSIMIANKLGRDNLDRYLRAFGFGKRTALEFPGETAGILKPANQWYSTDMGSIPIGQGVAVSPLQMIAAYNTVANGGVYVAPKLVKAVIDGKGVERATAPSASRRVVSAATAREMTAMLNEVVRKGTGKMAAINGYTVAGKTGTARKPLEGAVGYKPGAYMSSFAGFVPSERPAFTTLVILDEPIPIYGGLVAAPVFAAVSRYALREFRVPPPPPAAPTAAPALSASAAKPVGEIDAAVDTTTTLGPSSTPPKP